MPAVGLMLLVALQAVPSIHAGCPPAGPWWGGDYMLGDADLLLVDVMVPEPGLGTGTYWSTINFNIGPRGGYCGIQNCAGRPPNNIFSIWDLPGSGTGQCTYSYKLATTVVRIFGGEGTGIHTHNDFGWATDRWYATVLRRWYAGGTETHVGFWMYDYAAQRWTHYVTLVTPETDSKFTGNGIGGFVEVFDGTTYGRHGEFRRPWKMLTDGTWVKPTRFSATADWSARDGWNAVPIGTDGIHVYACGDASATSSALYFDYSTPADTPDVVVLGSVSTAVMRYDPAMGQFTLDWAVDDSKAPQLNYSVDLFRGDTTAVPVQSVGGIAPEVRTAVLSYSAFAGGDTITAQLRLGDIFGGDFPPVTVKTVPPVVWSYTLEVNATNGHVMQDPQPTEGRYAQGTPVLLTAVADAGYEFAGYIGDVAATTDTVTVLVTANMTVTAKFHQVADAAMLTPAWPNPFRQSATLGVSIVRGGPVTLTIFTVSGRQVRLLLDESLEPGEYWVSWDGRDDMGKSCMTGIYYARLKTADRTLSRTVAYLR